MSKRRKRKCLNCKQLFRPDPRCLTSIIFAGRIDSCSATIILAGRVASTQNVTQNVMR